MKRSRTPGAGSLDEMRLMYYSANWQLLEERIGRSWTSGFTEDERAQTFWGKRYIDDAVARRRDRNVDGTYENNYFYITDAQFSTVARVSASNARVVERTTYDAYGKARHHFGGDVTGDGAATAAADDAALVTTIGLGSNSIGQANYKAEQDLNRDGAISTADRTTLAALTGGADQSALASGLVSFTTTGSGGSTVHGPDNSIAWDGYVFNSEAGEYHVRNRWYDPGLGRWLEADQAGYVDGLNVYQYVRSSPARFVDPLGNECGDCDDEIGATKDRTVVGIDVGPEGIPPDWEERIDEMMDNLELTETLVDALGIIQGVITAECLIQWLAEYVIEEAGDLPGHLTPEDRRGIIKRFIRNRGTNGQNVYVVIGYRECVECDKRSMAKRIIGDIPLIGRMCPYNPGGRWQSKTGFYRCTANRGRGALETQLLCAGEGITGADVKKCAREALSKPFYVKDFYLPNQ